MFKSTNFTNAEQISLSKEIAVIGVEQTPFTSLLMSKGNIEKALSTVYTWREKTLNQLDDISAVEGSDDITFFETARAELNNILEIFKVGVSISGTANAMKSTQLSEEVQDRLLELKVNMEKKFILGTKNDGSVAPFKRQMQGLIDWADASNAHDVSVVLAEKDIKEMMKNLWKQNLTSGEVYCFVNAEIKEQIDSLYKDRYNYSHVETNFGLLVDSINTNYGKVNFVLSQHIPEDKAIFFKDSYVDLAYLREPSIEALAKTGDNTKAQVVAEATLKVGSSKAVGVLTVTN
ncbi:phage major capsid protein [Bacillaceae bacterium SAOS 7]|nr:phage major capsid protein [Bacillaceae bacterium SAOS 7]